MQPITEHCQHLRHRIQERNALLLNKLQAPLRLEALHQYDSSAGHRSQAHQHNAIDMIEWYEDEHTILSSDPGGSDRLIRVTHEIFVTEQDSLRQARRATAIGKGSRIITREIQACVHGLWISAHQVYA